MNATKGSTMKKIIMTATAIVALAGFSLSSAQAGDREWATVGKVLTGAVAVNVITHSVAPCQPVAYTCPAPVYCAPPVPVCAQTYCPPPVYVCQAAYCPPPAPVRVYTYCPPPRVVVIHNWSPTQYSRSRHEMVVYSTPRVERHEERRDRW